jgi:hypothetical protein
LTLKAIGGEHTNGAARKTPNVQREILLDLAADRNFVSRRCAADIGTIENCPAVTVEVANGELVQTNEFVVAHLTIGTLLVRTPLLVFDMPRYDIVFGLPWFLQFKPQFDWDKLQLRVQGKNGTHVIRTVDSIEDIGLHRFNLIQARPAVKQIAKQGAQAFLWIIREHTLSETSGALPVNIPLEYQEITRKYRSTFRSELPDKPPTSRSFKHPIDTGDARPVNVHPYQLSHSQLEEQRSQVHELLKRGLIRVSSSPWGAPVLFVQKPGEGQWRMCIDYRALNNVTKKNTYPLPRIQDCLDRIGNAKCISKLDLLAGFHQLPIEERDIEKTAFNTRIGKFEYTVMPFGLTNAPSTFQTMMNTILQPFLDSFVIVYLDDIVIFSNSPEEHKKHLDLVLDCLARNELFAKPSKCIIGASEIEFCGHRVGNGVIRTSRSKTSIVEKWPTPKTVHDVRAFLGLASYYRRFVKSFANISAPLTELLKESDQRLRKKKYRPIVWTAQCQLSFDLLKHHLTQDPVLTQPDFAKAFVIETDASEWALGCCLLQLGTDGILHPVAFDGRKFQGAELNYSVQDKELLAIKHAVRTWAHYIDNHTRTKVYTDHESLKYLKDTKVPSKRLAHWIAEFGTYDLDITYRPGSENTIADAISRRSDFIGEGEAYLSSLKLATSSLFSIRHVEESDWEEAMIRHLRSGEIPKDEKLKKALLEDSKYPPSSFELNGNMLYRKTDTGRAPYLHPIVRRPLLEHVHRTHGHFGWPALNGALKNRAWWPTIEHDVQQQIRTCPGCLANRTVKDQPRTPAAILDRTDIELFESWSIDLIGRLPRTYNGNRWIITAIERSTGWPVVRAVSDATSQTVMNFIHEEIFSVYGIPNEILSDNGTNLVGEATETFLRTTKLKHRHTSPYHPNTNGKIERFNGILGGILAKTLYGKPVAMWDEYLSQAVFACRIRTHAISRRSPFWLLYGIEPRLPGDPIEELPPELEAKLEGIIARHARANESRLTANRAIVEKAIKAKLVRDEHFRVPNELEVGDHVLVRDPNKGKFKPRAFGPYKIVMSSPLGTYALQDTNGRVVESLINGSRMSKIHPSAVTPEGKWKQSYTTNDIRSQYDIRQLDNEILEILDEDAWPPYTYKALSTVSKREWTDLLSRGLEKSKIGEGLTLRGNTIEQAIFEKLQDRVKKLEKAEEKEDIPDQEDDVVITALPSQITKSIPVLQPAQVEKEALTETEPPIETASELLAQQESVLVVQKAPNALPREGFAIEDDGEPVPDLQPDPERAPSIKKRTRGRPKKGVSKKFDAASNEPDPGPASLGSQPEELRSGNPLPNEGIVPTTTRGYDLRKNPQKSRLKFLPEVKGKK